MGEAVSHDKQSHIFGKVVVEFVFLLVTQLQS